MIKRYQTNADQKHSKMSSNSSKNGCYQKEKTKITHASGDMEEKESLHSRLMWGRTDIMENTAENFQKTESYN